MKSRMITSKPRRALVDAVTLRWNRAHFRRLKPREQVWVGDYVKSASGGFEPWDGPGGFSAQYFAKPVYRLRRGVAPRRAGTITKQND